MSSHSYTTLQYFWSIFTEKKGKANVVVDCIRGVIDMQLEAATEHSARAVQAVLTLNIKLAKECEFDGWVDDEAYRLLYSSKYNTERRLIQTWAFTPHLELAELYEKGWFDHLEEFPTREDLPRQVGESSKGCRLRHLKDGSIPQLKLFTKLVGCPSEELNLLKILDESPDPNQLLRLLASYAPCELNSQGINSVGKKEKLRIIRKVLCYYTPTSRIERQIKLQGWQDFSDGMKPLLGKVLKSQTYLFCQYLRTGPSLYEIYRWLLERDLWSDRLRKILVEEYWDREEILVVPETPEMVCPVELAPFHNVDVINKSGLSIDGQLIHTEDGQTAVFDPKVIAKPECTRIEFQVDSEDSRYYEELSGNYDALANYAKKYGWVLNLDADIE